MNTTTLTHIEQKGIYHRTDHKNSLKCIFVAKGEIHIDKQKKIKTGSVILLSQHSFKINIKKKSSVYIFEIPLSTFSIFQTIDNSLVNLEVLKNYASTDQATVSKLHMKKSERKLAERYIALIEQEKQQIELHKPQQFYSFLFFLASVADLKAVNEEEESVDLLDYIRLHIHNPQALQIKEIAQQFDLSPNYFGAFFKRKYDCSYKIYVDDLKLESIKKELENINLTFKEIVDNYGFIDESHLTHFFKKKTNLTPSEYRKQALLKS